MHIIKNKLFNVSLKEYTAVVQEWSTEGRMIIFISFIQPERIDPSGNPSQYDIRSDVWSLGISLLELATLRFPYNIWGTPFEQLKQVVKDDPPRLPPGEFSPEFEDFIIQW
jgi:serine/threonine protein kinase